MSYLIKNGHIVGDTGTDYAYVGNKPLINNNELTEGNHTSQDLGITKVMTLAEYNAEPVHSVDCLYIILDGDMQNPDANYNDLANKPSVNGVVLTGNKPLDSLDLYDRGEVDKLIAASRSIRTVTEAQWAEIMADPEKALPNTVYYVPHRDEGGTLVEGVYEVYLFDANKVLTPMGLTEMDLSDYLKIIPYHSDSTGAVIYEIGHNEGKEDGRELESHSVINAINEIDTALQDRVKVEEEDLETDSKKVVEAINELKEDIDNAHPIIRVSGQTGDLTDEQVAILKKKDPKTILMSGANYVAYPASFNGSGSVHHFMHTVFDTDDHAVIDDYKLNQDTKKFELERKTGDLVIEKIDKITMTIADSNKFEIVANTEHSYQLGRLCFYGCSLKCKVAIAPDTLFTVGSMNVKPLNDVSGNNWYTVVKNASGNYIANFFNASVGINRSGTMYLQLQPNVYLRANDTTYVNFVYMSK